MELEGQKRSSAGLKKDNSGKKSQEGAIWRAAGDA